MFSTLEKIKELAQKQGISLQKVAEDLGYSINYLYTLKEKTPKSDRLQEIADYFNVSMIQSQDTRLTTSERWQRMPRPSMASRLQRKTSMPSRTSLRFI